MWLLHRATNWVLEPLEGERDGGLLIMWKLGRKYQCSPRLVYYCCCILETGKFHWNFTRPVVEEHAFNSSPFPRK